MPYKYIWNCFVWYSPEGHAADIFVLWAELLFSVIPTVNETGLLYDWLKNYE